MNKKFVFALIFLFLMSSLVVNVSAQKTTGKQQVTGHLRELADSFKCIFQGDMDCFVENVVASIPLIAGFLIVFTVIFFFARNAVFKGENGQNPAIMFGIGVALLALWQGGVVGIISIVSGPLLILIFVMIVIIGIMWTLKMRRESGFAITPDEVREKTERKKAKQEGKRSDAIEKKETDLEEKLLGRERKGFRKLLNLTKKDLQDAKKVHEKLEGIKKNIKYVYQIREEPKSVQLKEQILKQIQSIIPYATKEMAAEDKRKDMLEKIEKFEHKELDLNKIDRALIQDIKDTAHRHGFTHRRANTAPAKNLVKELRRVQREQIAYMDRLNAMEAETQNLMQEMENTLTSVKDALYNNQFPEAEQDMEEVIQLNSRYIELKNEIEVIEKWMRKVERYQFAKLNKRKRGILNKLEFT